MKLVNKLNWNDMPVEIAIDAIKIMINNRRSVIEDCCLDSLIDDDSIIKEMMFCSDLFADLFVYDYETLCDDEYIEEVESHKDEIISLMKKGVYFNEARTNWKI